MARRRDGSARREWRERLKRFQRGGATVAAFCRAEGVSTASFYAWRRRLEGPARRMRSTRDKTRGTQRQDSANRPLFVPVSMAAPAAEVRIELAGGAVVCVPASADERLARTWLRAALDVERDAEDERC